MGTLSTSRRIGMIFALLLFSASVFIPLQDAHADGGAPQLAYVSGTSHGISVIDIAQMHVTKNISVPGDPQTIQLSLDGSFLYVTQPTLGGVAVIAAGTGRTICTAHLPGHPTLLALDPGSNLLYAAGNDMTTVSAIDASTCALRQTFQMDSQVSGLAIAVVGAGPSGGTDNQIWVATAESVSVLSKGKQLIRIPLAGGPQYMCIPLGMTVYVTTRSGSINAINLSTYQAASQPLLTGGVFGPMDYDANTGEVYVPDEKRQQVDVLTPVAPGSTTQPLGPVTPNAASFPHEPARVIHMSAVPQSIAITSDGQQGFVALSDGKVVLLDIPGRQITTTSPVGGHPRFIITGLKPPLFASTPQQVSLWNSLISLVAYALIAIAIIAALLLATRYRRITRKSTEKQTEPDKKVE